MVVNFREIVTFSSEDVNNPAENLLKSHSYLKWKCKAGLNETQQYVILKLEKLVVIDSLDIGNEHSAFVEVLVSRDGKDFQVLLVASSFMTPLESRNSINPNRVRIFAKDKLTKDIVNQKWDHIKVICSQPFNKRVQYGLVFITIHSNNKNELNIIEDIPLKNAHHSIKEKEETVKVTSTDTKLIEHGKSQAVSEKRKKEKVHLEQENLTNPLKRRKKETTSSKYEQYGNRVKSKFKSQSLSFEKLMDGVVFTLSGYQNPTRSKIRDKLLEMGASYKNDWSSACTHLICAFKNTPKFRQVKGRGKIVTEKWVHACHSKGVRLPWRRFALDSDDNAEESEDEIVAQEPQDFASHQIEENRVLKSNSSVPNKKNNRVKSDVKEECSENEHSGSDYSCDTDVDEEHCIKKDTSRLALPELINVFNGDKFLLDAGDAANKHLGRYIAALGGISFEKDFHSDISYVVVNNTESTAFKKFSKKPHLKFVQPEWIWDCYNKKKLIEPRRYILEDSL